MHSVLGAQFQVATIAWQIGGVEIVFNGGDLDEGMILVTTDKSQHSGKNTVMRLKEKF
jgi:hypothetical protein